MNAGDTPAVKGPCGISKGLHHLICIRRCNGLTNEIDGQFPQNTGGFACGVTFDPAFRRIRGAGIDTGQFQGGGVGCSQVQVAAPQQHRVVRCRPVQRFAGGHAWFAPVGFVPSLTHDPLVRWSVHGCSANAFQQILEAGEIIQPHALTVEGPFIKVDMRIDKPWQHQAAVEVDFLGACAGQMQDVVVGTRSKNLTLPNGNCLGHRLSGVLCGNDGVKENNLGP